MVLESFSNLNSESVGKATPELLHLDAAYTFFWIYEKDVPEIYITRHTSMP